MSRFGYSHSEAEKVADRLDLELKAVEFRLGRIARAVPEPGAITARLQDAGETVQAVVDDLNELVRERTEEAA